MPVIQTIEARRSIDIGGIPDTRVDNSIGQGISQLGNAIGNAADAQNALANRRLEMQRQVDEFAQNQALQRWQDDNALEFAQMQQQMDPSGRGFTDTVSGIYTKRSEEFLKSVPANLQPRFQELVATARNQWIDKGAAAEIDQRNTWYRTGITERQQTLQNQVFNDPAMFDAAKADAYRTIDASGLPPAEKEALKKKTDEMFALTIGEREIRDAEANPSSVSDSASRLGVPSAAGSKAAYRNAIASIESKGSGGYAAVGPKHEVMGRALGRYQIMEANIAPWSKAALGREVSVNEFMDPVTGPAIQDAIFDHRFGSYVSKFGAEGAAQAWFAGEGGVGKTARKDVLGTDVGTYGKKFLAAMGQPEGPQDNRFATLSLSQRLSLYDQMQAAAKRGQMAIDAQQTAAYNQQKGALQLGIQTGDIASAEQILSSGMTDSDKATLISALRSRQGDQIATAEAVAAFQAGGLTVDPYSTDGRKRVDAVGDVISKAVPAEQQQAAYEELVRQSGTLPQSVLNKIRAGADSQVAADVEAAMNAASRFAQVNPSALGRREGGEAIQRKVDDFDYYVNTLNLSPSDAARRIAEQNDPNKVRDRKALEPAAKEFRKQLEGADIGAIFDDSVLGWRSNPNVGFTEGQAAGIAADYLAIAEEQFYATGGNTELAKSRANQEMKRLYGVTEIGGSRTIMKYPPEKFWPSMPGASDPYAYAKDQLIDDLAAAFPDDATLNPKKNGSGFVGSVAGRTVDIRDESGLADYRKMVKDDVLSRVILVATPETGAEVKSNQLPGYTVLYKDEQGNFQTLYGKQWRPDPKAVSDGARQQQADRLGRAQIYQQTGQGIADFLQGGQVPMGAGQAWDNPEAQQKVPPQPQVPATPVPNTPTPTIQGNLSQQRSELFQNARNSGMLTPGGM